MIHVLTVHWKRPDWIRIQLRYLQRFLTEPFASYCFYTGIDPSECVGFDHAFETTLASHPDKLNTLADIAIDRAQGEDDILLFLDGDAFPIRSLNNPIEQALSEFPLLAVQRLESGGDMQPHPCFCATTVGFWKKIAGDWNAGYHWTISNGRARTDVGGNLLASLLEHEIPWRPLVRTAGLTGHGMYFSIYGNLVYHHGAGFRDAWSTYDMLQQPFGRFLHQVTPNALWPAVSRLLPTAAAIKRNNAVSRDIFKRICSDPGFFDRLDLSPAKQVPAVDNA